MLRNKTFSSKVVVVCFHLVLLVSTATLSTMAFAETRVVEPSANTTLTGTTQTFTWSTDEAVERWWLYVGTAVGARDITNSGDLGTNTQHDVIGIPVDGSTIHARLWYYSSARWNYIDSLYSAAMIDAVAAPTMVSPANESVLTGGSADFQWRDNDTPVNYWRLYVGSTPGSKDFYNSESTLQNRTSVTVNQLPVDGSAVYVRLWYRTTSAEGWRFADSTYGTAIASVPAFPGAQGHGAESIGGRGGIVVKVTNLNDSGPGSLRDALMLSVPRTIVFEVSGTIELQSRITLNAENSFFTVAGQTAPGDGIAIRNHVLRFKNVQHGILRHLRVRHGCDASLGCAGAAVSEADNIQVLSGSNNLILDHLSMTWADDESINIYGNDIHDVTVQRSLIAEGVTYCVEANEQERRHNLGSLFGGLNQTRITIANNYIAHTCYRNFMQIGGQYEYINGVNYNTFSYDFNFSTQDPETAQEPFLADVIGYNFKEGPQTTTHYLFDLIRYGDNESTQAWGPISLYLSDITATTSDGSPHAYSSGTPYENLGFRVLGGTSTLPVLEKRSTRASEQAKYPVSIVPSTQVPDKVLPTVGASLPKRDPVDERIVNDFYSLGIWDASNVRQYPLLSTYDVKIDSDNDGMPDNWESDNGLDPLDSNDHNGDINNDGYTNIENYINSF